MKQGKDSMEKEMDNVEIPQFIETGGIYNMMTFNQCLWTLLQKKQITTETALQNSDEKENLTLMMKRENYKIEE